MIIFHPNIKQLFLGRGVFAAISNPNAVTVFSGTQPTAASITSSWSTYSPLVLVHWQGAGFTMPLTNSLMTVTSFPPAATATGTGTATWAIIWASNVTPASVAGSTLPNTSFIVCPVTNTGGNGVIRVTNTSITAGTSVSLADASIVVS